MSWFVWKVGKEGDAITKSGILRTTSREIDESFIYGLSFRSLSDRVREYCPTAVGIFAAFATTRRQKKELSELSKGQKDIVSFSPFKQHLATNVLTGPCRSSRRRS